MLAFTLQRNSASPNKDVELLGDSAKLGGLVHERQDAAHKVDKGGYTIARREVAHRQCTGAARWKSATSAAREEHHAVGPVCVGRQLLHAMRGRGLSPHHVFPRPSRRHGHLHGHAARRQGGLSGAAVERQPDRRRRSARRPPFRHAGKIRSRSRAICSRWWPASWSRSNSACKSGSGKEKLLQVWVEPHDLDKTAARDGFAGPLDRMGRGALRPGARSGPLHDRRGERLQHGRDGKQGLEHLQHEVRAGEPRNGDRHRLRQHRSGGRPRVFPQLDRQPRDLPRLVPVEPEGRPDRVPRPGIFRRHGRRLRTAAPPATRRARPSASTTCACCARCSSPKTRVRWRIRCARKATSRSTTSTR